MGMFLEWRIEAAQWPRVWVWGDNALGFRQWVPDEIHLDVSLKCGAVRPCEVTCPTPCAGRLFLTLSFSALCPVALCTASDGASTTSRGKPPPLKLSLCLRRLPWYSAQGFLSVITSHSSRLYPFAWPERFSAFIGVPTPLLRESIWSSCFCQPWALLIPGWCCGNPYK